MKNNNIKTYSLAALFSALLCISAWICVPSPIPFTMQTLTVAVAGAVLGRKNGTLAVLIYLLLGILGLPVFAGFKAGIGVLLGPTGGFTLGFLAFSAISGAICKNKTGFWEIVGGMLAGLFACYVIGSFWYYLIYLKGSEGIFAVISACVLPFIIPDIAKILLGAVLVKKLKKHIK